VRKKRAHCARRAFDAKQHHVGCHPGWQPATGLLALLSAKVNIESKEFYKVNTVAQHGSN
jgi:hypothetical protein